MFRKGRKNLKCRKHTYQWYCLSFLLNMPMDSILSYSIISLLQKEIINFDNSKLYDNKSSNNPIIWKTIVKIRFFHSCWSSRESDWSSSKSFWTFLNWDWMALGCCWSACRPLLPIVKNWLWFFLNLFFFSSLLPSLCSLGSLDSS